MAIIQTIKKKNEESHLSISSISLVLKSLDLTLSISDNNA